MCSAHEIFFSPLLATTQIQFGQGQAEIQPFGEGSCTRAVTYHLLGLTPPVDELPLAREAAPLGSMSSPQTAYPKPTVLFRIVPKKFPSVPGLSPTPLLPTHVQAPVTSLLTSAPHLSSVSSFSLRPAAPQNAA